MVILVLNNASCQTIKSECLRFKILIKVFNSDLLVAAHIFTHPWNTEAPLIEIPLITCFFGDFSIDESFLKGFQKRLFFSC